MTYYGIHENQQEVTGRTIYMVQACHKSECPLAPVLADVIVNHCATILLLNGRLKPFVDDIRGVAVSEAISEWSTSSSKLSDSLWNTVAKVASRVNRQ